MELDGIYRGVCVGGWSEEEEVAGGTTQWEKKNSAGLSRTVFTAPFILKYLFI
jgi:hypothetical protein